MERPEEEAEQAQALARAQALEQVQALARARARAQALEQVQARARARELVAVTRSSLAPRWSDSRYHRNP